VAFLEPRVHVITLAVDDLERAMMFYRDGLGLPTEGVVADQYKGDDINAAGAIVIFKLENGLILSLYPRRELAKDANIPPSAPASGEFSIGHIVGDKSEVDRLLAQAKEAGAVLTDEAHERPWGIYSGYFRDLDGHLWEIIWHPGDDF
jgi:catechol 2,3-dioxygenase-like lactoylglutathione lyase family enzyme